MALHVLLGLAAERPCPDIWLGGFIDMSGGCYFKAQWAIYFYVGVSKRIRISWKIRLLRKPTTRPARHCSHASPGGTEEKKSIDYSSILSE